MCRVDAIVCVCVCSGSGSGRVWDVWWVDAGVWCVLLVCICALKCRSSCMLLSMLHPKCVRTQTRHQHTRTHTKTQLAHCSHNTEQSIVPRRTTPQSHTIYLNSCITHSTLVRGLSASPAPSLVVVLPGACCLQTSSLESCCCCRVAVATEWWWRRAIREYESLDYEMRLHMALFALCVCVAQFNTLKIYGAVHVNVCYCYFCCCCTQSLCDGPKQFTTTLAANYR